MHTRAGASPKAAHTQPSQAKQKQAVCQHSHELCPRFPLPPPAPTPCSIADSPIENPDSNGLAHHHNSSSSNRRRHREGCDSGNGGNSGHDGGGGDGDGHRSGGGELGGSGQPGSARVRGRLDPGDHAPRGWTSCGGALAGHQGGGPGGLLRDSVPSERGGAFIVYPLPNSENTKIATTRATRGVIVLRATTPCNDTFFLDSSKASAVLRCGVS